MEHLDSFLAAYGYWAIFALLTLGIVGPWIPDETILVLSGLAVHRGQLELLPTVGSAFAGSLCGITLSYWLGRSGVVYLLERSEMLDRWVGKHIPQVQIWFDRYGPWTLFFGYFIAGVRHFTALGAGMSKLRFGKFALWAYPGGFVWVVCFLAIGYYLGAEWDRLEHRLNSGVLVTVAVLAAIGGALWWVRRKGPSI